MFLNIRNMQFDQSTLVQPNPAQKGKICLKNNFLCAEILHPLLVKVFKSETTLSITVSKGFWISNNLDIWLWEVGTKRHLNGTSTSEQTYGQTPTQTSRLIDWIGPDNNFNFYCLKNRFCKFLSVVFSVFFCRLQ